MYLQTQEMHIILCKNKLWLEWYIIRTSRDNIKELRAKKPAYIFQNRGDFLTIFT